MKSKRAGAVLDLMGLAAIGVGLGLVWFPLAFVWFGLSLVVVSARMDRSSS